MIDYHIHTKLCGHAKGEPAEYCEQAVKIGLKEIGFSDHFPMNYQPDSSHDIKEITMREKDIDTYLKIIDLNYKGLKIKKGFEVDYYPLENLFFKKYNDLYDNLDFVIGSVHFIDEIGVDQEDFKNDLMKYGVDNVWTEYIYRIKNMINEYGNYIDIVGHLDLPKRTLGAVPYGLLEEMSFLVKLIKSKDIVVEINTSGWDKVINEQYPSLDILRMLKENNVEITLGSDAHSPSQVGRYFEKIKFMLKDIGFCSIIKFSRHNKECVKL